MDKEKEVLDKVRENIILDKNILYFDYTASGLGYAPIEDKILQILKTYANTHSEVSSNAIKTQEHYKNARESLRNSLEISNDFYILPCGTGSTGAIKKFQELMGIYIPPSTRCRYKIDPKERPLVIVGPYEHHSNEISFREALCDVIRVPLDENDSIDWYFLENTLRKNQEREIIASFSVASNVTGVLTDYRRLHKLVKSYNGTVCLDAAAASPYMNIPCQYYDALFLSPHKLLGGVGSCGILVVNKSLCQASSPTFAGGGTVLYVSRTSHVFLENVEAIEDVGTPGILQFIKASFAYELRNEIGLDFIHKKEEELKCYFGKKARQIEGAMLYCNYVQKKLAIFSLNIEGVHQDELAKALSDDYGIQTRSGCSCAGPYGHDLLELCDDQEFNSKPGWLRVSMHFTHTKEQIDTLLDAIEKSAKKLRKMKEVYETC